MDNTARGTAKCCIRHKTTHKCCISLHTSKAVLKCYIALPGQVPGSLGKELISSTQTASNFIGQTISKCLHDLFLVVEQVGRISWASLVI